MASWWWLVLPVSLLFCIIPACLATKNEDVRFASVYCLCCGLIAGIVIGLILGEHGVK